MQTTQFAKILKPQTMDGMSAENKIIPNLPNLYDRSVAQVHVTPQYDGILYPYNGQQEQFSYQELRQCAKHPLVKLALDLLTGELQGVPWRYEFYQSVPFEMRQEYQGSQEWIDGNIRKIRDTILTQGIRNMLIYGYAPFEAIYQYNQDIKLYEIKELKPLLHEYTYIRVHPKHGDFIGIEQRMPHTKTIVRLKKDECFLISLDVQGQNWYGTSALEAAIPLWRQWNDINNQVKKFFDRCVGSRTALHYPVGKAVVGQAADGEPIYKDNSEIAREAIIAMEQNFGITLPNATVRSVDMPNGSVDEAWKIETFSDTSGNVPLFIERQRQIEEWLVNAVGMPIRMFQEGRASGSRAELESFTDIACTIMESRNHALANAIQEQIINHLTLINFGIEKLIEIQIGNIKQSELFFERHPTLDPSKQQNQIDQQVNEASGDETDHEYDESAQDDITQGQAVDPQQLGEQ